ncbi:hypothetical protein SAMN04487852_10588 [Prevotella sp. tf2-5]|nr:hypothetical protein SAMN04487852_10588 [Prevotella sp. tf2-5]
MEDAKMKKRYQKPTTQVVLFKNSSFCLLTSPLKGSFDDSNYPIWDSGGGS